jgi:hypothetical protein
MTITAEQIAGAVKPLEWQRCIVDWSKPMPRMKYVACSATPTGSWTWWLDGADARSVEPSEQLAKAAAQADYAARILAALDLQPILDTIRAEATAAAYGAAGERFAQAHEEYGDVMHPRSHIRAEISALTDADATAWLADRDAAQFKAGQEAALKGAVKEYRVYKNDVLMFATHDAERAEFMGKQGYTIRPCLILVGEGE